MPLYFSEISAFAPDNTSIVIEIMEFDNTILSEKFECKHFINCQSSKSQDLCLKMNYILLYVKKKNHEQFFTYLYFMSIIS